MLLKLNEKRLEKQISHSNTILDLLAMINHQKMVFWKKCNLNSLTLDMKDFLWPLKVSDDLVKQIFPKWEEALNLFLSHFECINVITDIEPPHSLENINFYRIFKPPIGSTLRLSLFEAIQLYTCLSTSTLIDESYLAIQIEDQQHFIVSLPGSTSVKAASTLIEENTGHAVSHLSPFDPVTGKVLDSQIKVCSLIGFLFYGKELSRFDYPFPYRNLRKNEIVKITYSDHPALNETPCCNCLSCVSQCPTGISPNILYHLISNDDIEEIDNYDIDFCIGCGKCSVVCPSNIPLYSGITDYLQKQEIEEDDEDS